MKQVIGLHPSAFILQPSFLIMWLGVVLGLALAVASYDGVQAQAAPEPISLTLTGPERVEPGQVIRLSISVAHDDAATLPVVGGFEAHLRFDPSAAEFAAFYPQTPQHELSVARLAAPQLPTGSAVGFYACGTAACLGQREVQAAATVAVSAAGGGAPLMEVELLALREGVLEVGLEQALVVGVDGAPLAVRVGAGEVRVQVGESGEVRGLPASGWPVYEAMTAGVAWASAADVTGSGRVSHGDVMEAALAWQAMREGGNPCGGEGELADVNGDGCVDVVDVQLVAAAAHVGEFVPAPSEPDHEMEGQQPDEEEPEAEPEMPLENDEPQPPAQSDPAFRIFMPLIMREPGVGADIVVPNEEAGETADEDDNESDGQSEGELEVEPAQAGSGATFVVNSTLDEPVLRWGDGVCLTVSGVCTLRAAIAEANAAAGPNTILFNIPGGGVHTIQLSERLPTLRDERGPTLIDGYSQPGASSNTDPHASNAQIRIELRGAGSENFDGMVITSGGNTVRGLAFYNFKRSIWIYGPGAQDNVILGNFIGTDAAGAFRFANTSEKQAHGLHIEQGAVGNRVGGLTPAERNIISGNARHGIGFWHVGTDQNHILNNIVGLNPGGTGSLSNRVHGVDFNFGAAHNMVGGFEAEARNVLSGNNGAGAEVSHAPETRQNQIVGNYIGTTVDGNSGPAFAANGGFGIMLKDRVVDNLVAHNVIGNNRGGGIFVDNFGNCCTSGNVIEFNRIGLGVNGAGIGNSVFGVSINAPQTRVGPENIIAHNPVGVQVVGGNNEAGNTITQNAIYGNVGLGIDLAPLGQANGNDPRLPVLQAASTSQVTGVTCPNCTVEIFIADRGETIYGQGQILVGTGTAGGNGAFVIAVNGVQNGDFVTATSTDATGSTTEFSLNLAVSGGQPWQQVFAIPGRIEAQNYREGGQGVGYHDTTARNSGRAYRSDDVDIEATQDSSGEYNVGWVAEGEWLAYDVNVASSGTYNVAVRVATPWGQRHFSLELDGVDVTGPVRIPWTGGWQTWIDVNVQVPLTAGPQTLRFVAETDRFNANYFEFTLLDD